MTSRWEGLPIALLEAMSLGIPSIVSDCSEGIRDLWQLPVADVDNRKEGPLALETSFGVLMPLSIDASKAAEDWAQEVENCCVTGCRRIVVLTPVAAAQKNMILIMWRNYGTT